MPKSCSKEKDQDLVCGVSISSLNSYVHFKFNFTSFSFVVSNKIVKLHGGNIGVYSEGQNSGSTFYVDIPISNYIQKNGQSLAAIDNTTLSYFESLVMTPRIGVINHSTVPNSSYSDKTDANASHLSKPPRKLMSTSDDDNSRRTVGTLKTSSNSSRLSFIFNSIRSSFSSGSGRDGRGGLKIGIAEGTRIKEEGDDIEQNVVSIRSTDNDSTILFANQPEADDASRSSGILSSSTPSTINHALSPGQVIGPGGLAATATAKPNSTMSIATTSEQSASSATSKINDGGLSNATSPNKASQTLTSPSRLGTRSNSGKLPASLNKRVLIVDDAPTNRKLINRLLRDRIMHRDEAVDGNDVSFVIVDVFMFAMELNVFNENFVSMTGMRKAEKIHRKRFDS